MIDLDKTRQVVKSVSDRVKRDTMSVIRWMLYNTQWTCMKRRYMISDSS